MATTYRIVSTAGVDHGRWKAATAERALLAMHRDAGYGETAVWLEDGALRFGPAPELGDGMGTYRDLLGDVGKWRITAVCSRADCALPPYAAELCEAHYRRTLRGSKSCAPVRPADAPTLVRLSVRLPPAILKALGRRPSQQLREVAEAWAKRQR